MNVNTSRQAEKPCPCSTRAAPMCYQQHGQALSADGKCSQLLVLLWMLSASGTKLDLLQHIVGIHCVLTPFRKPYNVIVRTAGEIHLDACAVFHLRGTMQFNG